MSDVSVGVCSPQTLVAASGAGDPVDVVSLIKSWLSRVCELLGAERGRVHEGELAAFSSYAVAFPQNFLPVIDSYSVARYSSILEPEDERSSVCLDSSLFLCVF